MHMPYIYKIFGDRAKIIPIIVGQNDNKMIEDYGKLFSAYLIEMILYSLYQAIFVIG
jgi:predicted class III extradiol MEMO1 family dioxygenase